MSSIRAYGRYIHLLYIRQQVLSLEQHIGINLVSSVPFLPDSKSSPNNFLLKNSHNSLRNTSIHISDPKNSQVSVSYSELIPRKSITINYLKISQQLDICTINLMTHPIKNFSQVHTKPMSLPRTSTFSLN